ncbi:RidA family protein [Isosphaeraceae bacterium EP7]
MTRTIPVILSSAAVALGLALPAFGQAPAPAPEKKFLTKDGSRPTGLFAPGVAVGKTVYVAGKGDYRPDADLSEKVKNCLGEIRKTLQAGGLDLKHVVKSFVYLEDSSQYAEFNKHYGEFFPENPPARTTLGVAAVPGESRLEITCIAYSDLDERKQIGTPPAGFPYSPGILAGDTLYVSGKGDQLPDKTHPATFEEQFRQTMKNVQTTLNQAGLDFKNVVMSHVFLDDSKNLEVANKVYKEFFAEGDEPACATVFVDWIPGGSHSEVTCIATTKLEGRKVVRPSDVKHGLAEGSVAASPGVWAGPTLYLSALAGSKTPGADAKADLDAQIHQVAKDQVRVLDAAGLKLEDIVSGYVYLREMKDYDALNAIYRQYFSKGPGVRTCLTPNSKAEQGDIRVRASFIAAKTRQP